MHSWPFFQQNQPLLWPAILLSTCTRLFKMPAIGSRSAYDLAVWPLYRHKLCPPAGQVYGVATEDMDALTFGACKVVRHLMAPSSAQATIKEFDCAKALQVGAADWGLGVAMSALPTRRILVQMADGCLADCGCSGDCSRRKSSVNKCVCSTCTVGKCQQMYMPL